MTLMSSDGIGIALGILGIVLSIIQLWQSRRRGRLLLNLARGQLKERLQERLIGNPRLLTEDATRSAALVIEKGLGAPVISDDMIALTIRELAVAAEGWLPPGPQLSKDLRVLDRLLVVFDPDGPRLQSIASVDRVRAYYQSVLALVVLTAACQIGLLRVGSASALIGVYVLNLFYAWVVIGCARAFRRSRSGTQADQTADRNTVPESDGVWWLDFFERMAKSRDLFAVHLRWAPIWETLAFIVAFGAVGALLLASLSPVGASMGFRLALGIGIGAMAAWAFRSSHTVRYLELRRLRARLRLVLRNEELARQGHRALRPAEINGAAEIYVRLWAITGDGSYRELAIARGAIGASDPDVFGGPPVATR